MMKEEYVGRKFKTFFEGCLPDISETIVRDFMRCGDILSTAGMVEKNAGNISIRYGLGMLIKSGGSSLGSIERENVVFVSFYDAEENTAISSGVFEPSSETPMHWMIYSSFPEIGAIVHAHDMLLVENPSIADSLGITTTPLEVSYGTLSQARQVINCRDKSNYIFIRGHGSVSFGKTLSDALDVMMEFHRKIKNESKKQ